MTLQELLKFLGLYVCYPKELGKFKILNENEYCRYPMIAYSASQSFSKDMSTALEIFRKSPKENFYFIFKRDTNRQFSLVLCS